MLANTLRMQQAMADWMGPPQKIASILFRRDGYLAANPDYAARTLEVTVTMSEVAATGVTGTFANNYGVPPVTVFTKKNVQAPDAKALPNRAPAEPWNFEIVFDTQFNYSGSRALLYELVVTNTSAPGKSYPLDASFTSPLAYGFHLSLIHI